MTRSEVIEQLALLIAESEAEYLPVETAELVLKFIETNRMSTHQADEYEKE